MDSKRYKHLTIARHSKHFRLYVRGHKTRNGLLVGLVLLLITRLFFVFSQESKRDELKRLIITVATVERKTQIVKDRLLTLFNGFHDNATLAGERFGGIFVFCNVSKYSICD